jgi:hypothetical protein
MIAIDLTPRAIRICSIGKMRWAAIQSRVLIVLGVLGLSLVWQAVGRSSTNSAEFVDIQSEVVTLEQQLAQHAHEVRAAQREHERSEAAAATRDVMPTLFDLLSGEQHEGVSLSKLQIALDGAMLEGYAHNAQAIARLFENISSRCPRIQPSIERMRTVAVSNRNVESFQARLAFSLKQHGAAWCQDGVQHDR